jgi:hypothetical protein
MAKLITKITSVSELQAIAAETFLNTTSKVTKITDESILNGHLFAIAKLTQKALKDIAVLESRIFPDAANGTYLDSAADLFGVSSRLSATGSSTYLLIKATAGTEYLPGVHIFVSQSGIQFQLTEPIVVGVNGFAQVQVNSVDKGEATNVKANTITIVSPQPEGHIACINEYMATGGADEETDENFRLRIKNHPNLIAKSTLDQILVIIQKFDNRILRIVNAGIDENLKLNWKLLTRNGVNLSAGELDDILSSIIDYLSLTDVSQFGRTASINLSNAKWHYVGGDTGVDFRVSLYENVDSENIRKEIQVALTKIFDLTYWKETNKVQWDDLLDVVKQTPGVKYVPDEYFLPHTDEVVKKGYFPRIKNFKMRDMNGTVLFSAEGITADVFYG